MKTLCKLSLILICILLTSCCDCRKFENQICKSVIKADEREKGLTVKDGTFFKDGKPYRGIGINYFTALTRITGIEGMPAKLSESSHRKGFEVLREYEIPFVRIAAGGFYPVDWQLYLTDKHAYFKAFDRVVADAEYYGIGLIPSLFWYYPTIPDIKKEHISELGNPDSESIAFIRKYTREVVNRYGDSPAIWAWEMGNEYIHEADLPQPELGRGWLVPEFGTPTRRTDADKLYRKDVYVAYKAFVDTVRLFDHRRPVISGDTLPRFSAFNNYENATWKPDTKVQWAQMLIKDNEHMDTLSVHLYSYDEKAQYQDGGVKGLSMDKQLELIMDISRQVSKPVFIGEFGPSNKKKPADQERREFENVLSLILENEVPMAALWNYDFVHEDQMIWNVRHDNERYYMLEALREANRSIKKSY
jgi:hypothetical protein